MGYCPFYSKDCPHNDECELYADGECVFAAIKRLLAELLVALP